MIVLGIETSCDETAAAVVEDIPPAAAGDGDSARALGRIRANIVLSQLDEHRAYGGVVPEIAARAHASHLDGWSRVPSTRRGSGCPISMPSPRPPVRG